MTVAAVMTCFNEIDIAEITVRHLLANGISRIYVADASDDGTKKILKSLDNVVVIDDRTTFHDQERWTHTLADLAHAEGADLIVPVDFDEFWISTSEKNLAEELEATEADRIYVHLWHHRDWEHKYTEMERLPKTAYRWRSGAKVDRGAHNVNLPGEFRSTFAANLQIRHYQYRGEEHFVQKMHNLIPRVPDEVRARGDATHLTDLEHYSDDDLREEYRKRILAPVVYDPIPVRS